MANFEARTLADKARRMDMEMARSGSGMGGLVPPAPTADMRGGGLVPVGPEGVDTVPAVMEGGTAMLDAPEEGRQEYVLTPEMVEALGGVEELERLRAAVHDPADVEARREVEGEGMVPPELVGQESGAPLPPEDVPPSLVPRMAAGGMEDDYFSARLANGGVLRNNAGAQIGTLMGGQIVDERGRARAYLGGMAGGGPALTPEEAERISRMQAQAKERAAFAGEIREQAAATWPAIKHWASQLGSETRTPYVPETAEPRLAPAPPAAAAAPAEPAKPTLVPAAPANAPAAAPAPAAGKYSTGPWQYVKPGFYGSPKNPFVVSDEGGVQVIRGPGNGAAFVPTAPKAADKEDEYGAVTVVEGANGERYLARGNKSGELRVDPLASTIGWEYGNTIRQELAKAEEQLATNPLALQKRRLYLAGLGMRNGMPMELATQLFSAEELKNNALNR